MKLFGDTVYSRPPLNKSRPTRHKLLPLLLPVLPYNLLPVYNKPHPKALCSFNCVGLQTIYAVGQQSKALLRRRPARTRSPYSATSSCRPHSPLT
jgi:hypothetical protein